jgi:hypothetical protein
MFKTLWPAILGVCSLTRITILFLFLFFNLLFLIKKWKIFLFVGDIYKKDMYQDYNYLS